MADYIYPAPGTTDVEATLTVHHTSKAVDSTGMLVPSLQDITICLDPVRPRCEKTNRNNGY